MRMNRSLHRLAAVVELVDGFLDVPASIPSPRFQWDGVPCVPLTKPQSRYVFLQLAPGAHVLGVTAPLFEPCTMNVTLPESIGVGERLIRCVLQPGVHYAYPSHVTLVRGVVKGSHAHARLSASYCSARGRAHRVEALGETSGEYTLVLKEKLADPTEVMLHVELPDGTCAEQAISVKPGCTLRVDISSSQRT